MEPEIHPFEQDKNIISPDLRGLGFHLSDFSICGTFYGAQVVSFSWVQ